MSDIGISYSATTQPNPLGVRFGLSFDNTTLNAVVQDVDPLIVTLVPSGNVGEQILSGVAWPLAQTLGLILPTTIKGLFTGFSFPVLSVSPAQETVLGETLTVTPSRMSLSSMGDHLMVQASLDVR